MNRRRNGFTLVELLAVIVVLAIIMIIAVPAVMTSVRSAKKQSFFLYAQSLESKYVAKYMQEADNGSASSDCAVYDISKDLGLSDTGKYEGWVKVLREPASSGKKAVEAKITNSDGIFGIKYCIDNKTCSPYESVFFNDGETSVTVNKTIENGQYMCVQYEYPDNSTNEVKRSGVSCYSYADGKDILDTYKYSVIMTLKDDSYAVENLLFNENMSNENFNNAIAQYNENHKSDTEKLIIQSPVCSASETSTIKGSTTVNTTIVNGTSASGVSSTLVVNTTSPIETSSVVNNTTTTTTQVQYVTTSPIGTTQSQYVTTSSTTTNSIYVTTSPTSTTPVQYVTTSPMDTTSSIIANTSTSTTNNIYASTTTENSTITTELTSNSTTLPIEQTTTSTTIDINDKTLLLAKLSVFGYEDQITFSPYQFIYSINIPNQATFIDIIAEAMDPSTSTIQITGNRDLLVGSNPVLITVQNNTTNKMATYKINVRRLSATGEIITKPVEQTTKVPEITSNIPNPNIPESNATLKHLAISGYKIDFEPGIYDYDLITDGEDKLFIDYSPTMEKATVNMTGNENLKDGSTVTISVQSENKYYSKQYKIHVKVIAQKQSSNIFIKILLGVLSVAFVSIVVVIIIQKKQTISFKSK